MVKCPSCNSARIRIVDKGFKKILRFFQGDNRYSCRDCHSTWRERSPEKRHKLKRKRA